MPHLLNIINGLIFRITLSGSSLHWLLQVLNFLKYKSQFGDKRSPFIHHLGLDTSLVLNEPVY